MVKYSVLFPSNCSQSGLLKALPAQGQQALEISKILMGDYGAHPWASLFFIRGCSFASVAFQCLQTFPLYSVPVFLVVNGGNLISNQLLYHDENQKSLLNNYEIKIFINFEGILVYPDVNVEKVLGIIYILLVKRSYNRC